MHAILESKPPILTFPPEGERNRTEDTTICASSQSPYPSLSPQGRKEQDKEDNKENSSFVEKVPNYVIDLARDLRKK